jgi:hypothetical protein
MPRVWVGGPPGLSHGGRAVPVQDAAAATGQPRADVPADPPGIVMAAQRLFGENYQNTSGGKLPTWQYGFDGCYPEQTFDALDADWRALIAERRAAHC